MTASSNETPCLSLFSAAFSSSQRKTVPACSKTRSVHHFIIMSLHCKYTRRAVAASPRSRVSEVLNRKRGLSINMIRALHDKLGISAEILIRSIRGPKTV